MRIQSTTSLAMTALLRSKMRSLLTTLGIVIGVAAVVMMQSMGRGATAYVGDAISGLGSNMLMALPGASRSMGSVTLGVPLFTNADLEVVRRDAHDLAHVAAVDSRPLRVVAGSGNRATTVSGVTPEFFIIRGWTMALGRALNDDDERRATLSCVLGQTVRDSLYAGRDPVGQEVRVHNLPCRVVGVLEARGASAFGMDQDDVVLMPHATFARRIAGNERFGTLMAAAVSADRMDAARDQLTSILRARRHILPGETDDFAVRDPREIQALLESVTGMLGALLAGVAALSLLVGGIGVMNIMLVSVTERTREIGIRLAIGARSRDVLAQFLVESVVLSAVGGILGAGIGILGAWIVAHALHVPFLVPPTAVPIALGVSALVGVFFGVVPARKAARLNPLAALRFE